MSEAAETSDRHASWLELFFDLVVAVLLAVTGGQVALLRRRTAAR